MGTSTHGRLMFLFVFALFLYLVSATEQQFVLHPKAYQMAQLDVSLDNSPKCMTCRHIVTALRNHFPNSGFGSPDSTVFEADPCSLAPGNIKTWCADVFRKLQQCDQFVATIYDRSISVVQLCESCSYDQFPLPSVRYCDNSMYVPLTEESDRCTACQDLIRNIQMGADPCGKSTSQACNELQNKIENCHSYNKYIHNPFVQPRRICEECSFGLEDGTQPIGVGAPMYCIRPIPSPMLDDSICSVCVNVVHNMRTFPMDPPCVGMKDEMCSYVQERLQSCVVFNRMVDQFTYSALSVCENCYDKRNPLAISSFCPQNTRAGSPTPVFDPRNPQAVTSFSPGQFNRAASPFLKPEPPAPFPAPMWNKMGPVPGGNPGAGVPGPSLART